MSKTLTAILVTMALVVGLCPGIAVASDSTGGNLGVGVASLNKQGVTTQAQAGFVADRVYALIGNDYAMMISEKNQQQTVNIVDKNYKSKLTMVSKRVVTTSGSHKYYQTVPVSKYQYAGLTAHGVKVKAKSNNLYGLMSFAGQQKIACKYATLSESSTGNHVLGTQLKSNGNGSLTVFSGSSGKQLATIDVGKASSSFWANWSSGDSKISVSRGWNSGYTWNYRTEVYSFAGSKLKRVSSKANSATTTTTYKICPTIVQKSTTQGARYYNASGKEIESLRNWYFRGSVGKNYLFANTDGSKAKLVNKSASTIYSISRSSGYTSWSIMGDYLTASKNDVVDVYSASTGKKVKSLPKGQDVTTVGSSGSGAKYFTYKHVTKKDENGVTRTYTKPVDYYNSKFAKVNVKPALGRYLMQLPNGKKAYDSGLDKSGYLWPSCGPQQSTPDVVTAKGAAIKMGSYTLTRPIRRGYSYESQGELRFNGSKNAYCAKNSKGKFGFVSSSGKVVVPFKYSDVFSGSSQSPLLKKSNYAMVKSNGKWSFYRVNA